MAEPARYASSHRVHNLPVLLTGGGFRHNRHLALDLQNPLLLRNFSFPCGKDDELNQTSSVAIPGS